MGQRLCCLRPSTTEKYQPCPKNPKNPYSCNKFVEVVDQSGHVMTLEDCLMNSPALNPNYRTTEFQVLKQLPSKRVYPTSPDFGNTHFYTPRMSFSSGKLEKIEEENLDEEKLPIKSAIIKSGEGNKLKKKVSFKLPDEADIIHVFYSPKIKFD